jgi:hypothetical protein
MTRRYSASEAIERAVRAIKESQRIVAACDRTLANSSVRLTESGGALRGSRKRAPLVPDLEDPVQAGQPEQLHDPVGDAREP